MKLKTTRFGEVEVTEAQTYSFPEGILGFADLKTYAILPNPKGGPFQWLQSAEIGALAFVVTDPALFFPEYKVKVRPEDLAAIQLSDAGAGVVLVILTVPKEAKQITANLQGPLVFNVKARLAKQLVLTETPWTPKHRLFKD